MTINTELAEEYAELVNVSAEKAEEIDRATQHPGGVRGQLIGLLDIIYAADIPIDEKRSMTDLMLRLSRHEQMEQRFGTLLTNADVTFIKKFEAKHPNVSQREALICLFIKLGYDTREIARKVGISTRGMESIRYRLHKKIGRGKHESIKMYLAGV